MTMTPKVVHPNLHAPTITSRKPPLLELCFQLMFNYKLNQKLHM